MHDSLTGGLGPPTQQFEGLPSRQAPPESSGEPHAGMAFLADVHEPPVCRLTKRSCNVGVLPSTQVPASFDDQMPV